MKMLDLFSGIGGFSLAASWTGQIETVAFCEIDKYCRYVLNTHWPGIPISSDIKEFVGRERLDSTDIICGGDPCPIRSRARSNGKSAHPDLSGYFLALVGRVRPRWVVRENVPAPDDVHFATALETLGYRSVIIRTDAATITGQSRQRDIIVGSHQEAWPSMARELLPAENGPGNYTTRLGTRQIIPALTTSRQRYDTRDCYIWEQSKGLRILDGEERAAFAGFPKGWLTGISESRVARMCGNCVVPGQLYPIFRAIVEIERGERA